MLSRNKWTVSGKILSIENLKNHIKVTVDGVLRNPNLFEQRTLVTVILTEKIVSHKLKLCDTIKAKGNLQFLKNSSRLIAEIVS